MTEHILQLETVFTPTMANDKGYERIMPSIGFAKGYAAYKKASETQGVTHYVVTLSHVIVCFTVLPGVVDFITRGIRTTPRERK